jgi:hypothetical protein
MKDVIFFKFYSKHEKTSITEREKCLPNDDWIKLQIHQIFKLPFHLPLDILKTISRHLFSVTWLNNAIQKTTCMGYKYVFLFQHEYSGESRAAVRMTWDRIATPFFQSYEQNISYPSAIIFRLIIRVYNPDSSTNKTDRHDIIEILWR